MEKSKTLILTTFLLLQACSEMFYEQRPFDVSQPNQIFRSSFVVKEEYAYRFALIFDWSEPNTNESRDRQSFYIGRAHKKGLQLPMMLMITKDGRLSFNQTIQTNSSWNLDTFCYNKSTKKGEHIVSFWRDLLFGNIPCESDSNRKLISGPSRTLATLTLAPGNYHVEIRTLIPMKQFADMETFIEISPYSPKI